MALSMAQSGEIKTVKRFIGKEEVITRLREMGFVPGEKVQVVGHNPSGLILMVKGVKLALDRNLASRIIVCD
ncbi:MAG: ferrous iron transport protein A [Lachnospiraceae bacterium]|nr:ferrous iron transport protein A [Lachnospiraceae bacterium]